MADHHDGSPHEASSIPTAKLDLSDLPPVFVFATHFDTDGLHDLEEELVDAGASLTYDVHEAEIILSKASKKARIQLDLRGKGIFTEDVNPNATQPSASQASQSSVPSAKRQKLELRPRINTNDSEAIVIDDSSTASESEDVKQFSTKLSTSSTTAVRDARSGPRTPSPQRATGVKTVKVYKVQWFKQSKEAARLLPLDDFLSFEGRPIAGPSQNTTPKRTPTVRTGTTPAKQASPSRSILERAKEEAPKLAHGYTDRFGKRKFNSTTQSTSSGTSWEAGHSSRAHPAHLLQTTTSEYSNGNSSDLPEPPEWVRQGIKYACQRNTPRNNPNEVFIDLLKKIRTARLLTNDEIGVRAYSTSIASLAAYTHKLSHPKEILRLPGCDVKIANLFVEWTNTGKIKAADDIDSDEHLQILHLFYDIWGVGATTAREFYHDRGWKELDDIVEFGWSTLSRVQQIGVKYYEEFKDLIPRPEVEEIGRIVQKHAELVRDDKIQSLIVGGYRRGKEASGDVDIIISHPEEKQTLDLVNDVVASLEEEGWITHTLLLSLNSTKRGQETLPFRSGSSGGHGFDTLDKALVVWQDPHWPTKEEDLAANPKAKNPNIHRRVDIIISPWRTVGCAVTGWSGGTTFQRDLRRYAKYKHGWKFDSSGVRSRVNGEVVDVEGWNQYGGSIGTGKTTSMLQAERRVFEGMGLEFREPWERCTG